MKPLMPLKANDFAKHFSPPPPIIPPVINSDQQPSDGNNNTALYIALAIVFLVVVAGGYYLSNQNEQIMKQITLRNDSSERTMPGIVSNTSQTSAPLVQEETASNKTSA